jgi:hypothetical protein
VLQGGSWHVCLVACHGHQGKSLAIDLPWVVLQPTMLPTNHAIHTLPLLARLSLHGSHDQQGESCAVKVTVDNSITW